MTAGKGIVHAEMPYTDEAEGMQLWVNLRSSDKMIEPEYQEKASADLVKAEGEGVRCTIIAGSALG